MTRYRRTDGQKEQKEYLRVLSKQKYREDRNNKFIILFLMTLCVSPTYQSQ